MSNKAIYKKAQQLFLKVSWTHKITATNYDCAYKNQKYFRIIKVVVAILTSSSVVAIFPYNNIWTKIFSTIGAISLTAVEIWNKQFDINKKVIELRECKERLWGIREELEQLLYDLKFSDAEEDNNYNIRFSQLFMKLENVQNRLPSPSRRVKKIAKHNINDLRDNDVDENIHVLLPKDLWKYRNNNDC